MLICGALLVLYGLWVYETSSYAPSSEPELEVQLVGARGYESKTGSSARLVAKLPSGDRATVVGVDFQRHSVGDRVVVKEYRTRFLGFRRYYFVRPVPLEPTPQDFGAGALTPG